MSVMLWTTSRVSQTESHITRRACQMQSFEVAWKDNTRENANISVEYFFSQSEIIIQIKRYITPDM